jgi:hypothetical protein
MKFLVSLEFDHEKLIREVMENQPEHSSGCCLRCIGWKYGECRYIFVDGDTGKEYTLTITELTTGLELMMKFLIAGKRNGEIQSLLDPGFWDSEYIDMLIQFACLGEIVYG